MLHQTIRTRWLALLSSFALTGTLTAAEIGLDFQRGVATDGARADMPFTVGWTFTAKSNISVTALGVWDEWIPGHDLNYNSHRIGLWTENGTLLASNLVKITSPLVTTPLWGATFRFEPIQPVILTPGQTYRIGAEYTAGYYLDFYVYTVQAGPFTSSSIVFGSAVEGPANAGLVFPDTLIPSNQGYFGPNLMIEVIPEPTVFALLGASFLFYAASRRRFLFRIAPSPGMRRPS